MWKDLNARDAMALADRLFSCGEPLRVKRPENNDPQLAARLIWHLVRDKRPAEMVALPVPVNAHADDD